MIGLEGALFNRWKLEGNEGSKAYSKRGRIGNALPLMVEGSKACLNGDKTRDRRRARIEIRQWLEGTLECR